MLILLLYYGLYLMAFFIFSPKVEKASLNIIGYCVAKCGINMIYLIKESIKKVLGFSF